MSHTLDALMRDSLDHCVKCTICETHCPVAAATPLFPGPKYVGPQAERHRAPDGPSPDASLDYCSSCGICTQVCPQGVKIAEINSQARARLKEDHGVPLRDRLMSRPTLAGRLGSPVAPLANMSLRMRPLRVVLEKTLGIHRDAPMPAWAGGRFNRWARRNGHKGKPDPARANRTVVYFHGCGVNYYEHGPPAPRWRCWSTRASRSSCRARGVPPAAPEQRPVRRRARLRPPPGEAARAVRPRGPRHRVQHHQLRLMLKREAHEILGVEDEDLRVVGERLYDVMEYLAMLHDRGELKTDDLEPVDLDVPYHAPCQQRGHGIGTPAMGLMGLIPRAAAAPDRRDLLRGGGHVRPEAEKYDIAMAVGASVFAGVREGGAELSACDSETCRWWISEATGRPSVHRVELLRRSYRIPL